MANGDMEDLFSGVGGDDFLGETAFTPAQRFRQYAQRQTAPGGFTRDALYSLQSPLLQQYYLGGFGGVPRFGTESGFGGSFADFMGGYTGQTPANLRDLAAEIGRISQMSEGTGPGSFLEYLTDAQEGQLPGTYTGPARTVTPQEAALYRNLYGAGQSARENRFGLANLIALQRPGGGMYGGVVGQALGSVLSDLYEAYVGQNPGGNFLNYFLQQTAGDQAANSLANQALSQLYGTSANPTLTASAFDAGT